MQFFVHFAGLLLAFLIASVPARWYRLRRGVWIPGWVSGLSLLGFYALFFIIGILAGFPGWLEPAFFILTGIGLGVMITFSREALPGRWWQVWR
ncbi:MAG TPA: hypothetical protein VMP10_04775 [Chloroflexota bacterium]|nr:hypothetical protein [Chloroflexota bacterium]